MLTQAGIAAAIGLLLFEAGPRRRAARARQGEVAVAERNWMAIFDCRRGGAMISCLNLDDCANDECAEVSPFRCASLLSDRPDEGICRDLTKVWGR